MSFSRGGDRRRTAFWAKAADVSRDMFFKVTGPETGFRRTATTST